MKLIVVTPAGRERHMRLLAHYVLGSPEVAEWHLWENCRNDSDRAYLHRLAASDPRCRLKQLPTANGRVEAIGDFFRFCDDPDALYLRFDDDIVFVEDGFFPRFIARAEAERGKAIWFSPIVVNNAVCAFILQHFADVSIEGPITCQAMCPHAWAHASLPEALHPVLIEAVRTDRLHAFRAPDHQVKLGRVSINAIGFFGADRVALGETFMPTGRDDEEDWLSAVLPAKTGRPGKIFGDLLVAHFSYYAQESRLRQTGILGNYYRLAGLETPRCAGSVRPTVKDRLRWLRRSKRRPRYTVSLPAA